MGNYCTTIQVQSGDSCASLAARCGIPPANFTQYNPSPTLCSTLVPGEHVCCSSGPLPDYTPSPNSDGSCASRYVQPGDYCAYIAANYSITVTEIESYNTNTWGWLGCNDLQAGQNICISSGRPPFPAPLPNAVCGPQVPNTPEPPNGTDWASLNPCPLNACCDIWGQCGTTSDFCTVTNSTTGAPGTAAAGTNGCISNCGTEIVKSSAPAEFFSVGYFEAFNVQRPCLNMNAFSIPTDSYTHVHYAFGNITPAYDVNDGGYSDQFQQFLKLPSPLKRIMSFGGWAFSTDPSTYMIFREAVAPANAQAFAQNVANFLAANNLDGVDFDWEYPGEPDIPGIPAGSSDEGANYLAFLKELRALVPASKSISVAAPASYWYLRGFPIKDIAEVVDYIVYMTYDLHGIWDNGNQWSQVGCPGGNCLRSDINMTETQNALSMITKAGVPSNKVLVGITSYGRTFTMSTAGCVTADCTYTGAGLAGECTQTPGYLSNAEINQIIANNPTASTLSDQSSDTDLLIYNNTQWVGYMTANTKASRTNTYRGYNMGGTSEWAIDLEKFIPSPNSIDIVNYVNTAPGEFYSKIDCNSTCLNPVDTWTSQQISDFAYCGAAYIDSLFLSGALGSSDEWVSTITQYETEMICSDFPNNPEECGTPAMPTYCGNPAMPIGKFQALWMAAIFWQKLVAWQNAFDWSTVSSSLAVNQIALDFPMVGTGNNGMPLNTLLSIVGGSLSTAGGLASANPALAVPGLSMSTAGSILGILSAVVPTPSQSDTFDNLTAVIDTHLSDLYNTTYHDVAKLAEAIYQSGDLKGVPAALTSSSFFKTPLANFFYNAMPVLPETTEYGVNLQDDLTQDVKRGLVGYALGAGNYYFLKNVSTEADCSQITGAVIFNGYCYSLQVPGQGCNEASSGARSLPADSSIFTSLTKYEVDVVDLLNSSETCQAKTNSYFGAVPLTYGGMTGTEDPHPECFYNLPVLSVLPGASPCYQTKLNSTSSTPEIGVTYLPPNLAGIFTDAYCLCVSVCGRDSGGITKRSVC